MTQILLDVLVWALALLLALRLAIGFITHRSARMRANVKTMIVLGSGGHTAEMLALLRGMNLRAYSPRCYVVAATDAMSGAKAAALEAAVAEAAASDAAAARADATDGDAASAHERLAVRRSPRKATVAATAASSARRRSPSPTRRARKQQHQQHGGSGGDANTAAAAYSSRVIPRSREVGQPWVSSAATTARALWFAAALVFRQRPDLVLVNGPGTCIPVVAAAWLLRLLGLAVGRVVYVESIARVYRLSLSGKILYHSRMADAFFVQWEELQAKYPRAINAGRLM